MKGPGSYLGVTVLALTAVVAAQGQKPLAGGSAGTSKGNPLTDEFAEVAKESMEHWKVPGLAIAVIDGDDVFAEGYGFATLPDTPATPETLWYGASTTKAQVAAVLAHLIDTKQYAELADGWATTISSVIRDDFVLEDEWATTHLTLEDAVSHKTGMGGYLLASFREVNGTQQTPRDAVRSLRHLHAVNPPRSKYLYCNHMFTTLGYVIETVTGKWLGDVLRQILWRPLGMDSTYFDLEDARHAANHLASGYHWENETEFVTIPDMVVTDPGGAGAVISNVLDYAQWVKCLLRGGTPLSKQVHADIKQPRTIIPLKGDEGNVALYSLGWIRLDYHGHIVYTHSGGMHAFGAEVYWVPAANYGVVAFGNTAMTSNAVEEELGWKLIGDKLGIAEENREDKRKLYHGVINGRHDRFKNALSITFPDRADPPLPSTMKSHDLVGTYAAEGYGSFTLREEPHPSKPSEKILVADRPETTWRYRFALHHVSAEYWLVYVQGLDAAGAVEEFMPGQFKQSVSGKVTGLTIDWTVEGGNDEGTTFFEKVDE